MKAIIHGAGGGVSSDELTGILGDVVKGKTVVAKDSNDEIGVGTLELTGNAADAHVLKGDTFYTVDPKSKRTGSMVNVAAIDPAKGVSLSSGVVYVRMTHGAHITDASSGYPEVSVPQATMASAVGLTAAKLLAGQNVLGIAGTATNDANAAAANIETGKIAYVKGAKVTGTMATLAGGTYKSTTANQTISCANKKMTSNITIQGDSKLVAANIKKGVTILGVTGTWEGYVASPTDLYYYGQNKCGLASSSSDAEFQDTQVLIGHSSVSFTTKAITFTGYSKLNFLVQPCGSYYENTAIGVDISKPFSLKTEVVAGTSTAQRTISVPLSNFQSTGALTFRLTNIGSTKAKGKLLRIWLS